MIQVQPAILGFTLVYGNLRSRSPAAILPRHSRVETHSGAAGRQPCLPTAEQDKTGTAILRLSALIDLYIHPLYVLVSKILSSILNSPAPIHPLYHPLSTLSTVGPTYHFI
jgi:hypothetical protein